MEKDEMYEFFSGSELYPSIKDARIIFENSPFNKWELDLSNYQPYDLTDIYIFRATLLELDYKLLRLKKSYVLLAYFYNHLEKYPAAKIHDNYLYYVESYYQNLYVCMETIGRIISFQYGLLLRDGDHFKDVMYTLKSMLLKKGKRKLWQKLNILYKAEYKFFKHYRNNDTHSYSPSVVGLEIRAYEDGVQYERMRKNHTDKAIRGHIAAMTKTLIHLLENLKITETR